MDSTANAQAERNRLANLVHYDILDSLPEQQYEDITQLAAHICQTPISLITFVDQERQWFKARFGFSQSQTPRASSFCAHAILNPEQLMLVPDARLDERFAQNPLVQEEPNILFYAGVPLVTPEGYALGTLCVIDTKPNRLSETQAQALASLGRQVMALLVLGRKTTELLQAQKQGQRQVIRLQKAKQHLSKALARERELQVLKSTFVRMVSHEFRTPLTTIETSIDLINSYVAQLVGVSRSPFQRHIGIIQHEIKRFATLLNGVLTQNQLDMGKFAFHPQPVDVVGLCRELLATHFTDRPDGRQIEFRIEGSPRVVDADSFLLTHTLLNILFNAVKFSSADPQLVVRFGASELVLQVTDQGIGIPAEDMPHLFEPFHRARNASLIEGTGLGLTIARQFIDLHGGRLLVESQQHQGTTCRILVPLQPAFARFP